MNCLFSENFQSELSQLVTEVGIRHSPAMLKLNVYITKCNRSPSK